MLVNVKKKKFENSRYLGPVRNHRHTKTTFSILPVFASVKNENLIERSIGVATAN